MSFQFDSISVYSSPVYFGPQRYHIDYEKMKYRLHQPADTECLTVMFESNPAQLEALLPEPFKLTDPVVTVMAAEFANIGWLAGNTYRILQYSIPVRFDGEIDHFYGDFLLALFENHCDPIVGGREGLGYCKIYCDLPRFKKLNGVHRMVASSWDFQFMKMQVDTNKPAADGERMQRIINQSQGKMNFKYIPGTGSGGVPDAAYPVFNPKWQKPDDYPFELMQPQLTVCDGSVAFFEPQWEDMPTYYQVAKGMYDLENKGVIGAQRLLYSDACDFSHAQKLR